MQQGEVASPVPFVFGGGAYAAYTLDELLAGAARFWDEGRTALLSGGFEVFLRAINEPYIADLAADLRARPSESADRRLREFLDRSRADDEPIAPLLNEDATVPLLRPGAVADNLGSIGRMVRRSVLPLPSPPVHWNTRSAQNPDGSVMVTNTPNIAPPSPAPGPPSVQAKPVPKSKERPNYAIWWYAPLVVLCVAPAVIAGLRDSGAGRTVAASLALSGVLSAMALLVGVGARTPVWARLVCFVPLATGLTAGGALVSRAVGPSPAPDTLVQVAMLLLAPLVLLLVQAATIGKHWKQWAWATALLAAFASAQIGLGR
jgi:hypothetical protein